MSHRYSSAADAYAPLTTGSGNPGSSSSPPPQGTSHAHHSSSSRPSAGAGRYSSAYSIAESQGTFLGGSAGAAPASSSRSLHNASAAGAKASKPNAAAAAASAWAPEEDDEEDSDEDWNVFDDYNNSRPLAKAPEHVGLSSDQYARRSSLEVARALRGERVQRPISTSSPSYNRMSSTNSYAHEQQQQMPYSDSPSQPQMQMADKRSSLLPASAFGFDVRNGDPRDKRVSMHSLNAKQQQQNARQSTGALSSMTGGYGAGGSMSAMHTPMSEKTPLYDDAYGYEHDRKFSSHASGLNVNAQQQQHGQSPSGIELVTVPALGAEYTEEERKRMTRRMKRGRKRSAKKQRFMDWARGKDKLCGFLDPRMAVLLAFFFFVALGLTLFFVIPRVPSFAFNQVTPFDAVPDASGMSIGYAPANFSMEMKANLRGDNTAGWIPSVLTDIQATVTDADTSVPVGKGSLDSLTFNGRERTVFQLPIYFSYRSTNFTGDQTYSNFRLACAPLNNGVQRPTLNLILTLKYNVRGLIGQKGTSAQLPNVVCPFILQNFQ